MGGFKLFGVIKETGVDDSGLMEFYDKYYKYSLYRDQDLIFYNAFGKNSIFKGFSWNPFQTYNLVKDMNNRVKEKKIDGNLIGEGLKTGGVFIFGKDGSPKYAYPEITGTPINEDEFLMAVRAVREGRDAPTST